MSNNFILSCESTVDMPYSYLRKRDVSVIFYSYIVNGKEFSDDMGRDENALPRFYKSISGGAVPKTSQLNEFAYEDYFEKLLQEGDVIHIAFGSGMTPSVNNAARVADKLMLKYPERRIVVIDSLCSSCGYGMLVDMAADMRDSDTSFDKIICKIEQIKHKIHHQFFSTDIKYLRRSGRISGPAATVASVLSICPIMHLDENGKIIAYDKVRGKKSAIDKTVSEMLKNAENAEDYDGKCFIGHANCSDIAKETEKEIEEYFPKLKGKIKILDIGTIIASHCGPGTVAVFFVGNKR